MSNAFRATGKKTNVIVYAGDGGTLDIGIQAMSGAFERGTDFLYICYDNEAYGNTGMQRSGGIRLAPGQPQPLPERLMPRKILMRLLPPMTRPTWQQHVRPTRRIFSKRCKKPCRSGVQHLFIFLHHARPLEIPAEKSVEMGKLAVKSGMWVLYEREYGRLAINPQSKAAMKNPVPLEEYLAPQGRFKGIDAKTVDLLKQNLEKKIKKLAAEEAEA